MAFQFGNSGDMDFNSNFSQEGRLGDSCLSVIAEESIINTIMPKGVAPEELSDNALRFIRYLLSISRAARFGFLPNFSDMDSVRQIARQFINYCGGAALALYTMNQVIEGEAQA